MVRAILVMRGARLASVVRSVRAVVDVTDKAPKTVPPADRIGTATQMMPGSCSSLSKAKPRARIVASSCAIAAAPVIVLA